MTESFSSGTTPMTTDTQRMLEIKILNAITSGAGGGGVLTGAYADPNGNVLPNNLTKPMFYYQCPATDLYSLWKWDIANQVWVQFSGV
jgi:hypothetical protein